MIKLAPVYRLFVAEFIGTALLLSSGISIIVLTTSPGALVAHLIPSLHTRQALSGFLFGGAGCLIALSGIGKISGAHVNPAVSIAFFLRGKLKGRVMIGYVMSQMLGAAVGCLPIILWGKSAADIHYGNTVPGSFGLWPAFLGEAFATACLVLMLFIFIGSKKLREYTPYTLPFFYGIMVWSEVALSGCSTNPARSFGPAIISGIFTSYWVYIFAPVFGAIVVVVLFKCFRLHHYYQIERARLSFHEHPLPQNN
jgi:aquaporin Z